MTQPHIAVVCAAHRGNGGMFSVDSAALGYFNSRDCRFDMFFAQSENDAAMKIRQRPVHLLKSSRELQKYSHVVYWGDFLNNPVYGRGDFARRDTQYQHSENKAKAFKRWKGLFIDPKTTPDTRLISVGNNFQHDFSDSDAFADIFQIMKARFHAILPRDPFSMQNISTALGFDGQNIVRQGMDCAFLQPHTSEATRERIFCYTFNRSKIEGTDRMVRAIEERTGLQGVEIPNWLKLRPLRAAKDFDAYRKIIASAQLSVSDTYHFLINSIVQGTPILAVGRVTERQTGTLGDFKKRTLFSMLGLEDVYLELQDQDADSYFSDVAERARTISEGAFDTAGRYRIAQELARKFRSDIDHAIFQTRTPPLRA